MQPTIRVEATQVAGAVRPAGGVIVVDAEGGRRSLRVAVVAEGQEPAGDDDLAGRAVRDGVAGVIADRHDHVRHGVADRERPGPVVPARCSARGSLAMKNWRVRPVSVAPRPLTSIVPTAVCLAKRSTSAHVARSPSSRTTRRSGYVASPAKMALATTGTQWSIVARSSRSQAPTRSIPPWRRSNGRIAAPFKRPANSVETIPLNVGAWTSVSRSPGPIAEARGVAADVVQDVPMASRGRLSAGPSSRRCRTASPVRRGRWPGPRTRTAGGELSSSGPMSMTGRSPATRRAEMRRRRRSRAPRPRRRDRAEPARGPRGRRDPPGRTGRRSGARPSPPPGGPGPGPSGWRSDAG